MKARLPRRRSRPRGQRDARGASQRALPEYPFGPEFFLQQLRAFVLDRCPDSDSGLPQVELHLGDDATLDICHIIGVAPSWVVLAVKDRSRAPVAPQMRTEIVPYACILRVTISSGLADGARVGFDTRHVPRALTDIDRRTTMAEAMLLSARDGAAPPAGSSTTPADLTRGSRCCGGAEGQGTRSESSERGDGTGRPPIRKEVAASMRTSPRRAAGVGDRWKGHGPQ